MSLLLSMIRTCYVTFLKSETINYNMPSNQLECPVVILCLLVCCENFKGPSEESN